MGRTRQDVEIAERVGRSAATVERHRLQGMWPADPLASIERHYEIVDACGLGTGRDNWAVAVDAAEMHGWSTVKLRDVLTNPPTSLVDPGFHDRIRAVLVRMAQRVDGLVPYTDPSGRPTADAAEAVVDDAYRVVGKTLRGETTEHEDFADLAELVQVTGDQAIEDGMHDDEPEDVDRPFTADLRDFWTAQVGRLVPGERPWAADASPDRLVLAVKVAAQVVDLCNVVDPAAASTGDERRAEIAAFASSFGPVPDVIADVSEGQFDGTEIVPILGGMTIPHSAVESEQTGE